MTPAAKLGTFTIAALLALPCTAQKLPAPSREVFRCEAGGKVFYSDAPCLGARKVDVQPTRGLDRQSGHVRTGSDVRREQLEEQITEAYRPIFGEDVEQRAKRHRRARLDAKAGARCKVLDREIPAAEKAERAAAKPDLAAIQAKLLKLRQQYRKLGC